MSKILYIINKSIIRVSFMPIKGWIYPYLNINFKIYVFKPIKLLPKLVLFTYNIVLYLKGHKTISRTISKI